MAGVKLPDYAAKSGTNFFPAAKSGTNFFPTGFSNLEK